MREQQDMGSLPTTESHVVKGAMVLGLAALLSKLIGTLQKIPLQNIAGDGVFGIYNAVYPFYILIVFLATAGFPVAISKFVAERMAHDDEVGARRILHVSMVLLGVAGIAGFILLHQGADRIAGWMDNIHTAEAIRCSSFALLIVPVMSAVRGYFQGKSMMVPTAVSQVAEQLIRVATMLFLLLILTRAGLEESIVAAGAALGSTAGGVAGLLVMMYYYRKERRRPSLQRVEIRAQGASHVQEAAPLQTLLWQLVRYAVLVCLGAIVVPMMSIVDTFTVPRLLKMSFADEMQAMAAFGIYNRGLPLVQLVGMVASSISVSIIPAITQDHLSGNLDKLRQRSTILLRWSWILGAASTLGIVLLAEPINVALYRDSNGTDTMAWVACMAVVSTINIMTGAILQGIGKVNAPAWHLLIAVGVKIALNLWLVPVLGMNGAAIAGVVAYGIAALLNGIVLFQTLGLRISWGELVVKPLLMMGMLSVTVGATTTLMPELLHGFGLANGRVEAVIVTLVGIVIGVVTFAGSGMGFGVITAQELAMLPGVKKYIPRLERLGLLKKGINGGMKSG
ncbi:putative polysaccharide biosynthesis protein [Paenibacillus terrigena]|uniref:putative polysaccharide biosynthesis protein n=1 Tax=Paenibacillus terrigena TaxID=369333 RepID=UPI000372A2F3|nr:oligosaccharide flippase family protein [Paenibacillus terrigena]